MAETPDKIQYHPGFYGAAELEFRLEATELEFNIEYNLSKKPLQVDLLIINKNSDMLLENEVGKIFRRYNLIEFKSPDDELGIDELFKTIGYACLYKSFGETANQIPEDEVTVSIFRDTYPRELFRYLDESGRRVEEKYPGVYYVDGNIPFATQIVVMNRLDQEKHSAFRVLSANAKEEDIRRFLKETASLENKGDRENADAVFEVSISANHDLYDKIRRDDSMCKAMEDLMQDVIVRREENAKNQGINETTNSIAVGLIKMGKNSLNEISTVTGLSLDALKNIENEMHTSV